MENKTYIISEIGINHNGSIRLAKDLISKSALDGANAVKFQKRDINSVYTAKELDTYRESLWGTTNREQKEGIEFNIESYKELYEFAKSKGLDFIVSCWDENSVKLIEDNIEVDYHKVASALLTDSSFLRLLRASGKDIILSTGMSNDMQIAEAVKILGGSLKYILACTSTYPTKCEDVNLSHITSLKGLYKGDPDGLNYKIGFSNHYNGADACVGAVALGAECIEFHITHDRTAYGSDQAASIENSHELIKGIRNMEVMLGDGIKTITEGELAIAAKLRKKNDFDL